MSPLCQAESRRVSCLQAMGMTLYASRRQLPGAASSRRIYGLNAPLPAPEPAATSATVRPSLVCDERPVVLAPGADSSASAPLVGNAQSAAAPRSADRVSQLSHPISISPAVHSPSEAGEVYRCSVAAVMIGKQLWLEELGSLPLTREQVQLMRAMAGALGWAVSVSSTQQFDWPLHDNSQFDLGQQAAASALQAFVTRQVSQECTCIVALGKVVQSLLIGKQLPLPLLCTHATRELLQQPQLKREAWHQIRLALGNDH